MAIEQHGVVERAGHFHEDQRRATFQPHHLDLQTFDRQELYRGSVVSGCMFQVSG